MAFPRFKLSQKVIAISAVLAIALALCMVKYIDQTRELGLKNTRAQLQALPIISHLEELLHMLQVHSTSIPLWIIGSEIKLQTKVNSIEEIKQKIELLEDAHKTDFAMNLPLWKPIAQEIENTLDESLESPKGFNDFIELTELILNYIKALSFKYHFYSGSITLIRANRLLTDLLPSLSENINRLGGLTTFKAFVGEKSAQDIRRISAYLSLVSHYHEEVVQALENLKAENSELYPMIREKAKRKGTILNSFVRQTDSFLSNQTLSIDPDSYFKNSIELTGSVHELRRDILEYVRKDLTSSIESYEAFIRNMIVAAMLISLVVLTLIVFISRSLVLSVRRTQRLTEEIACGDRNIDFPKVHGGDEFDAITSAIEKIYVSICNSEKKTKEELDKTRFLSSFSEDIQNSESVNQLARKVSEIFDKQFQTLYSGFFQHEYGKFRLLDGQYRSFSLSGMEDFKNADLLQKCLLEKRILFFRDLPDDSLASVSDGIFDFKPREIVLAPILFDDQFLAVAEFAYAKSQPVMFQEYLEAALPIIAIRYNALHNLAKIEHLYAERSKQLEESQTLTEELQTQQEELRTANEELNEQTKALQEATTQLENQKEELQLANVELEEQKQKMRESNEELTRAKKLVEEKAKEVQQASKYKSEFLANMSHELRTPLNSIMILSSLLEENETGSLSEKQMEHARIISSSGKELLNLINDILDLSKIESGKIELDPKKLQLKEFIIGIRQQVEPILRAKGLDIHVEFGEKLPAEIVTDEFRLNQIIKNFLSNAIKFTEHGSITIKVDRPAANIMFLQSKLFAANAIAISVIDTGIGISKDKQSKVFEAFKQADGGTSRKYGGTGLGLSISKELAILLGGELRLQSEADKGTTITAFIPEDIGELKVGNESVEPVKHEQAIGESYIEQSADERIQLPELNKKAHRQRNAKGAEIYQLGSVSAADRTLLIIEDDPGFAKTLVTVSQEMGYKCLCAMDGRTGLSLAIEYQPTAILLDIGLPDIDGWEVLREIKDNPELRHIPVHIISGLDPERKFRATGAIGYLKKPVSKKDINDALVKIKRFNDKAMKELLIVEDDQNECQAIANVIGSGDVKTTAVHTATDALRQLRSGSYDCMVLDMGLPDKSGLELLKIIDNDSTIQLLSTIIYTGKELTKKEIQDIEKYSDSIILKNKESSYDRLLDEVSLFLHRIDADMPTFKRQNIRRLHEKEAAFHGKRILLVDDDARNIFSLKSLLEAKGVIVFEATNGKEALDILKSEPPMNAVIMDIMMPEMNGYEAMNQIRCQEKFKDLPIIALTAKAMKGDREKCIKAGANDYLSKPVDSKKFLSLLRVWLRR